MKALAEALRFLSILPIPGKPPKNRSAVLAAYPWAGLILGILAASSGIAASFILGAAGSAVVVMAARIVFTGALHLDGLADLADGMGGGRDRERRLAIMADSRIGTFGTVAILLVTALQAVLIFELFNSSHAAAAVNPNLPWPVVLPPIAAVQAIILASLVSRGVLPLIMRIFPTARPGGMGDSSRKSASMLAVTGALGSTLLLSWLIAGWAGPIGCIVVLLLMLLISRQVSNRLGGLSGDVYGALIEYGDLTFLLVITIIVRLDVFPLGLLNTMLY